MNSDETKNEAKEQKSNGETPCKYPLWLEKRMREHLAIYGSRYPLARIEAVSARMMRIKTQRSFNEGWRLGYQAGVRVGEKSWQ